MKAFIYRRYGPPRDVLRLEDRPRPKPGPGEVLIRNRAVGLNGSDWEITTGYPFYSRIFGMFRPRFPTLGSDIAGLVEEVGAGSARFSPGDAVFGDIFEIFGGFAEFTLAPEAKLLTIPEGMSFEIAAAIPQSGTNALQPMQDARVGPGQSVLINGACGGAGTYAIQLACAAGAEVTAVDRVVKLNLARELGAARTLDFESVDFTRQSERYDLILDYFGTRTPVAYRRVLKPGGRYYYFGGTLPALFSVLTLGTLMTRLTDRTYRLEAVTQTPEKQVELAGMVARGELRPVIDRTYPFEELPEALERLGSGVARGKLVISLPDR